MLNYVLKRALMALPVMLAAATLVFLLIHSIPGDPVDLILGEQAMQVDREELSQELGLDRPLFSQYGAFLAGLSSGDWGRSLFDNRPVLSHIREHAGATIVLAVCAMFVAVAIAIPAGVFAAVRKGGFLDQAAMVASLVGISVPNFWLGPVLILVFAVELGWLPISGRESWASLILPAFTLGFGLSAMLSRLTRASMIDELGRGYVTTARAKGLSERAVILKHAFRNALNPVITIVGLEVGSLLAGAIITERIFNWPGIGSLLMDSINRRDYPLVQGCILVIAFAYVVVNAVTDCVYRFVDPRVKI
ncbi:MAG TPA: ABC transporter permease [bacterium]|nr:ABC transporter permease [bacterium]